MQPSGGAARRRFVVSGPGAPRDVSHVVVASAVQAADMDRAAIDSGIPSRALMQRAGAAAAGEILRRYPARARRGVAIFAGEGNNGGDAWVVAAALASVGVPVRLVATGEPRTDDARAERDHALASLGELAPARDAESLVVDGVLGIGARGAPRGGAAQAIDAIRRLREGGAAVVALDVPSGLDATTGDASQAVDADLTLTFGTMKRGLLVARARVGELVVLDIGLGAHATRTDAAPRLVDARWALERLPALAADAHKGTRGRLAIVGGAAGMAGAVVLAARAALRAGAGLVRCVVAPESVAAVQGAVPEAIAAPWPASDAQARALVGDWGHGILVGPGLGRDGARAMVTRVLAGSRVPCVLDADALNAFEGAPGALRELLDGRTTLLTPHPAEFARLAGGDAEQVNRDRFDVAPAFARQLGAALLLKGVPTVIASPHGDTLVSASGTPALATGGSGDLLAGLAATLVMQREEAAESGALAAWLHGRAAECAAERRVRESGARPSRVALAAAARGVTLGDVLDALPDAWVAVPEPPTYPVLAALPAVGTA